VKHLWAGIALAALYIAAGTAAVVAVLVIRTPEYVLAALGVLSITAIGPTALIVGQIGSNELMDQMAKPGRRY
jgi:hypothetical protein